MKTTSFIYSKCLLSLALLFWQGITLAQVPAISWQKSFGGSSEDMAHAIQQTTDGGYIVAGRSNSNDGDVAGNHGDFDYWIVKLDSNANISWQKSLGGSGDDICYFVEQTIDDGYIVAGWSTSNDGDITGNHGSYDCWIVKLDANGNLTWQKSFGGSNGDAATVIHQTTEGGYIMAGWSESNDGDITGNHGFRDYWIVKLDVNGNLSWQKSLGGSVDEVAEDIQQTTDGGYIVVGWSESNDGDLGGNYGIKDYWIVKLEINGNLSWQKSFGGSDDDEALSVQQTIDGCYIVAGSSSSNDGDVIGNHGDYDSWIVKLAANGTLAWQKCLGGSDGDDARSIQQTLDGGYIVAGVSGSIDGNVTGNHDSTDYWVVKLIANGTLVWQKCLGGSGFDWAYSIEQTTDGGYIVAGWSGSVDGDMSENHGGKDYWIVKLANYGVGIEEANMVGGVSMWGPNPVIGNSMSLDYYLSAATEVEISIIDVFGKQVAYIESRTKTIGAQSQVIDVGHLASGVYFVEIKTGYEVWREKVVKE